MPNVNNREKMKKEKVVGVRLDNDTFAILEWDRLNELTRNPENKDAKSTSAWVAFYIEEMLGTVRTHHAAEQKRLQTQAKRRASLEAKKAAANDDTK